MYHPLVQKIVTIGGGTGQFQILRGLKNYECSVTAIVNMSDDGKSSGKLRDEYGVLPPGDVRQCMVALADDEHAQILRDLGITKMKLLSNNPKKVAALAGYGLEITERVPIVIESHEDNEHYLRTKKEKLGHLLEGI